MPAQVVQRQAQDLGVRALLISETERVFLRRVRDESVALFCVLNKVDYLTPAEQGQALEFTCRVVAQELGQDRAVWPASARAAPAGSGRRGCRRSCPGRLTN